MLFLRSCNFHFYKLYFPRSDLLLWFQYIGIFLLHIFRLYILLNLRNNHHILHYSKGRLYNSTLYMNLFCRKTFLFRNQNHHSNLRHKLFLDKFYSNPTPIELLPNNLHNHLYHNPNIQKYMVYFLPFRQYLLLYIRLCLLEQKCQNIL